MHFSFLPFVKEEREALLKFMSVGYYEDVNWIELSLYHGHWQIFLRVVLNLWVLLPDSW